MNTYKNIIDRQFYRTCLLLMLTTCMPTQAFVTESGDLAAQLQVIDYGDLDENTWKQPSQQTQDKFSNIMDAFLFEDFASVDQLAADIGYQLVEFNDTANRPIKTYYILKEVNPLPSSLFTGGGTYVLNPDGVNVAIQAPHPISDAFTGQQAIDTFLFTQSKLLFLAGAKRDNSIEISPCTDGLYRKSDSSHYTDQLYYIAHTRASDADQDMVFIQLHGFGTTSLIKLQGQCNSDNDKLLNLSEGVDYPSDPASDTFMHTLRKNVSDAGLFQTCIYGNDTSSLGATWTTTGRYTNNSVDSCNTNADSSSERFIHIEQSYRIRSSYRNEMDQYLKSTISSYFKKNTSGNKGGGKK